MTRETTLKTSQVFSNFQRRLNFIGNMQLPDISPAIRVSAMPIGREGVIYPCSLVVRIMSEDAPGS